MTNGDRLRRTGDTDLAYIIFNQANPFVKCSMCTVGLDDKGRCRNSKADCIEKIFDWLGEEVKKGDK